MIHQTHHYEPLTSENPALQANAGDRIRIESPGGGGFGGSTKR